MFYRVTVFLSFVLCLGIMSSPVQGQQVLDQQFEYLLRQDTQALQAGQVTLSPRLRASQLQLDDGQIGYRAFIRTEDVEQVRRAGIAVQSYLGGIATARVSTDDLRALSTMRGVAQVSLPTMLYPHNDEASAETGARTLNEGALNNTDYQGQGVISCVIDSGIDVNHDDFKDASGNTRIRFLWDLTDGTGPTPADRDGAYSGLDSGTEYTASDIDGGSVAQEDTDGHGTHVAGTMAGNGRALIEAGISSVPLHQGAAPASDLVIVKAGNSSFSSANVADALSYCDTVADEENKSVVANMSLGTDFGPHDGTGTLAQITDGFTSNGTAAGRIATVSAGNSGRPAEQQHTTGTIDAGNTAQEPWTVETYTEESGNQNDLFGVNAWIDNEPAVSVTVTSPNSESASLSANANDGGNNLVETPDGAISIETNVNNSNGDRSITIFVFDEDETEPPAEGEWTIAFTNDDSDSFTYHAWTYRQSIPGRFNNGDNAYTIGSPGTAASALTVGAYAHRWRWIDTDGNSRAVSGSSDGGDAISTFSSRGPLRDGAIKPDIASPGQRMASAYSQDMGTVNSALVLEGDLHRLTQGTSMSAPAVGGAAALLLQEAPTLTANEVKDLITDHATVDAFVTNEGTVPNTSFGAGKLDIVGAMTALLGGSSNRELLAYESPWTFNDIASTTVGNGGSDAVALRFTPSFDGVVTGTYITLGPGTGANQLTDPLEVEVWSDNSGTPDAQIGQTVTVAPERLMPFSANYVSLLDAEANVTSGTDYHIILRPQTASDEVTIAGEDASTPTGRSQELSGSTWSDTNTNLIVRGEVATTSGVGGALPVELASFGAQVQGDQVVLHWRTLSETDNSGFTVEHAPAEADAFETLGFVEGHGTTSEPQAYQFTTDALPIGEHTFRLRQIDVEGAETVQESTTARIGMQEPYQLSSPYPNPGTHTRFDLVVQEEQHVTATVYNVLGQRVATLHEGPVAAESPMTLAVRDASLPSGVYFLRISGETFATHRKFTRVR